MSSKEQNRKGWLIRKKKAAPKADLNVLASGAKTLPKADITIQAPSNPSSQILNGLVKQPSPQIKILPPLKPKIATEHFASKAPVAKKPGGFKAKVQNISPFSSAPNSDLQESYEAINPMEAEISISALSSSFTTEKKSGNLPADKSVAKQGDDTMDLMVAVKRSKDRVQNRESCRDVFRGKIANREMHVVEYEPQVRVCKFHLHGQNSLRYLAMPYMQFTRYVGEYGLSLHVSFTNEPLQSISDDVYFPPLPNVWYPSLQVCLMNCPARDGNFSGVMKYFWNTRYLDCEDWYCFPVLDHETPMRTFQKWERMTTDDPSFITKVQWTHKTKITDIPRYDHGGDLCAGRSGKPEYGGTATNRNNGPIRGFAIIPGVTKLVD